MALSQKQVVALSGDVYRRLMQTHDDNPGTPEQWAAWKGFTRAALEGRIAGGDTPAMEAHSCTEEQAAVREIFGTGDLTASINAVPAGTHDETALRERCGRLALWVLQGHGIEIDRASHLALLREIAKAALQAGWQLKRQAGGDYRPDPLAERFPTFETASATTLTLPGLFEKWKEEVKPAGSTVTTWRGVVSSLVRHLGHEDAKRVSAEDIVRWKDSLVVSDLSPKTINDSYLACIRTMLTYGVTNKLLRENVVKGIKVSARRRAGTSKLPYTDAEVARLLSLAASETLPARRWLPLLQATTGARVGELAQLWAERVKMVDGVHVMELRPAEDGGTFKNEGSERVVPIHPAVIAAGFFDFARGKGRGPLFYGRSRRRDASRHASKGTSNHLAAWIRDQGFTDPRKAPNHAFRHWFKSCAARAGIADSIADHLQGHAASTDAGTYRHFELATLATAISRLPLPTI